MVGDAVAAFQSSAPDFGAGAGSGLDERIATIASEQRHTDEWVGEVGDAFAAAGDRTGAELDAFITALAGQPTIVQQQAADDAARVAQLIEDEATDEEIVAALVGLDANSDDAEYAVQFFEALGPEGVVALDERLAEVRQLTGRGVPVNEFVDDAQHLRDELVSAYSLASQPTDPGRDGVLGVGVLTPAFHEGMIGAAGMGTLLRFTGQPDTAPMTDAFLEAAGRRAPEIHPGPSPRGIGTGQPVEDLLANIAATSPDAAATLLHDADWSDWLMGEDSETYGDGRAGHSQWHGTQAILMGALGEMPEGHTWAEDDFDRLVREHWSDDVPEELRVTLAIVSGNFLDGMPDRYAADEAAISGFFEQVTKDDEALGIVSLGLGSHANDLLDSGFNQLASAPDGLLPREGWLGSEIEEIGSLYGLVGDGLQQAEDSANARASLMSGFFQFVGGSAKTIAFSAATVSGPWWAAAGIGIDELADLGSGVVESANDYEGMTADAFLNDSVTGGIRANVALSLYDNAALFPELGTMSAPPEILSEPLPLDASAEDREAYAEALQDWLGDNRNLHDQADHFTREVVGAVVDELDLDPE